MSNCSECNSNSNKQRVIRSNCNPEPCGCKFTVDGKCIVYNGQDFCALPNKRGDNLDDLIMSIDTFLCNLDQTSSNVLFRAVNIGAGEDIYAGSSNGIEQFKTLNESDSVLIHAESEEITIAIKEDWLSQFIQNYVDSDYVNTLLNISIANVGAGVEVYKGVSSSVHEIKSLIPTDSIKITSPTSDTIDFKVDQEWLDGRILEWITSNSERICQIMSECTEECTNNLLINSNSFQQVGCEATVNVVVSKCPNEVVDVTFTFTGTAGSITLTYDGVAYVLSSDNRSVNILGVTLNDQGTAEVEAQFNSELNQGNITLNWMDGIKEVVLNTMGCNEVDSTPSVYAGEDVGDDDESITLQGSLSDPDNVIVSTVWTQTSGSTSGVTIINADTLNPTVQGLDRGVYEFTITATDGDGNTYTDSMLITIQFIRGIQEGDCSTISNADPIGDSIVYSSTRVISQGSVLYTDPTLTQVFIGTGENYISRNPNNDIPFSYYATGSVDPNGVVTNINSCIANSSSTNF